MQKNRIENKQYNYIYLSEAFEIYNILTILKM